MTCGLHLARCCGRLSLPRLLAGCLHSSRSSGCTFLSRVSPLASIQRHDTCLAGNPVTPHVILGRQPDDKGRQDKNAEDEFQEQLDKDLARRDLTRLNRDPTQAHHHHAGGAALEQGNRENGQGVDSHD